MAGAGASRSRFPSPFPELQQLLQEALQACCRAFLNLSFPVCKMGIKSYPLEVLAGSSVQEFPWAWHPPETPLVSAWGSWTCVLSTAPSGRQGSPGKGSGNGKAGGRERPPPNTSPLRQPPPPPGLQLLRQEAEAQLIAHPLISLSALRIRQGPPTRAVPGGWIWRGSQPPGSPWPGMLVLLGVGVLWTPPLLSAFPPYNPRTSGGGAQASEFRLWGLGPGVETGSDCPNGRRYRWVVAHGDGASLGAE